MWKSLASGVKASDTAVNNTTLQRGLPGSCSCLARTPQNKVENREYEFLLTPEEVKQHPIARFLSKSSASIVQISPFQRLPWEDSNKYLHRCQEQNLHNIWNTDLFYVFKKNITAWKVDLYSSKEQKVAYSQTVKQFWIYF